MAAGQPADIDLASLLAAARYIRDAVWLKLLVCLLIDLIGLLSYLLPVIGELGDIAWAPLQGAVLVFMFGSRLGALGFIEEIVPGLDFVPTATIGWFCENVDSPSLPWLEQLRALTGVTLRRRRRD